MLNNRKLIFVLFCNVYSLAENLHEPIMYDCKNIALQKATGLNEYQLHETMIFLEKQESYHNTWSLEYPIINDLIKEMNLQIGCEIGVAFGKQSVYFLENTPIKKLYSIDCYQAYPGYNDWNGMTQQSYDVMFFKATARLSIFGERSVLLRETSVNAAKLFEDNTLDFVYIDAHHAYAAVMEDIISWAPKIRSGGLIAGDDYRVYPSTARAVNDYVNKHNIQLHVKGNKWWFIKP